MTGSPSTEVSPPDFPVDTDTAHPARVYDYLLGGSDHFEVDRRLAERVFEVYPDGVRTARADVQANRGFLGRVVRYLATEARVRQFLDIGTGIPTSDGHSVHEVVGQVAPAARVVYADNDPVVLAHAHKLLDSPSTGTARYVHCDLRSPRHILQEAAQTLDFTQPIAVLLLGVLHFIPDDQRPQLLVRELLDHLPSGSYLAVSHLANDVNRDVMAEAARRAEHQPTAQRPVLRERAEVTSFFDGLELVEPGVVRVDEWRPTEQSPPSGPGEWRTPIWCGVGRTP